MPDEFASVTRNDALADVIAAEIAAGGPIPFARFMELTLYHPALGYYRSGRRRIGARGDYLTSPHLGPVFGAIIGRQLAEVWERLGRPGRFVLVEAGADDGRLSADIAGWAARARPEFAAALAPLLVEPDPATRDLQRRTLATATTGHPPLWLDTLDELTAEPVTGAVLSNELVDAFPVRLFEVRGGTAYEVLVGGDAGRLVEVVADVPAAGLGARYRWAAARLADGARFEVNEAASRWVAAAGRALARGVVMTIDYGYPFARLYAPWRTQGTLMAFYRHTAVADPLAHPGEQDLTAHVDFTSFAAVGRRVGLEPAGYVSQREFLTNLGIHEAVVVAGLAFEETAARRRAVLSLCDPAGLGRVRVLLQSRGLDAGGLRGFAGAPRAWDVLLDGVPEEIQQEFV
jgi:SAM-dependent MidA family methyltransferase